jgi:ElaB/YqjD/DUF883 family membrane-anchored ribosome-binding protein
MDDRTTGIGDADDQPDGDGAARGTQTRAAGAARRAKATRSASAAGGSTTRNKRTSGAETPLDSDTDARTRELEAEIADTREDLSETVEAIQEKLRPSHIISEGTDAVKTAATERVRDMADTATDTAYRVVESTRQNPWPALMIGAGVAWLLIDRTRDGGRFDNRTYQPGRYQGMGYEARGRRLSFASEDGGDEWTREGRYDVASSGRGMNTHSMRNTTRRAQTGLQRMLHENPLLVAAAAVLTGAAVGGAIPQTEKENELMGEARDQMVDRAQNAAREAADSVRDVAGAVQDVARQVTDPGQR